MADMIVVADEMYGVERVLLVVVVVVMVVMVVLKLQELWRGRRKVLLVAGFQSVKVKVKVKVFF
jgi:hypothetical protein